MTPVLQMKNLELKLHKHLHSNLKLLTYKYPTTKEFDNVFKPHMFAKNNKAAFQHVIYYLFQTLNPEMTKEKITSWPLLDIKSETQFRNEVLSVITFINNEYKYADIPTLMASHLMAPGGLRFVKFMLRLANLVIFEYLKKSNNSDGLWHVFKACKNSNSMEYVMNNLRLKNKLEEKRVCQIRDSFNFLQHEAMQEAADIVSEQVMIREEVCEVKKLLLEKQVNVDLKKSNLIVELNDLQRKLSDGQGLKDKCVKGNEVLAHLTKKLVLHFDKADFAVPKSVQHFHKNTFESGELNLHCLFKSLLGILETECLELPLYSSSELDLFIKTVAELNEMCLQLKESLAFCRKG